jgi:hypothetical protein
MDEQKDERLGCMCMHTQPAHTNLGNQDEEKMVPRQLQQHLLLAANN